MNRIIFLAALVFGFTAGASLGPVAFAADAKPAEGKPAVAAGPGVKLIEQQLQLAKDGSGTLVARIHVTGASAGKLDLPFAAWGEVQDFKVEESPPGAKVELFSKGANPHLTVVMPAAADMTTVRFSFTVPAPKPPGKDAKGGEAAKAAEAEPRYRAFAHRFMNGTAFPVERYRLEVLFPEGYVVHTVPEALPKAKGKETTSRVRLLEKDGRQGAALEIGGLRLGDTTSMRIEYEPAKKSLAVLWFGLLLSVLYLVFFRDVLRPQPAGHAADERGVHSHKQHE